MRIGNRLTCLTCHLGGHGIEGPALLPPQLAAESRETEELAPPHPPAFFQSRHKLCIHAIEGGDHTPLDIAHSLRREEGGEREGERERERVRRRGAEEALVTIQRMRSGVISGFLLPRVWCKDCRVVVVRQADNHRPVGTLTGWGDGDLGCISETFLVRGHYKKRNWREIWRRVLGVERE